MYVVNKVLDYIFLYWEIGYTFLKQQEQCFYEKRDPNRIEMGRRFREARERLNWSREVLAERADLSVSFIADLELGNTGTRLENFIRLCRLLDLNADYVLFGAPGDAVQRITDLLRDRDEETVRVVERTVEALLRALDEQQTT